MMRNYLKHIFYLQRNDRKALFVLLLITVVCIFIFFYIDTSYTRVDMSHEDSLRFYGNSVSQLNGRNHVPAEYYQVEGKNVALFPFDPNTADSTQLLALGLQAWQVRSIYRYRAKGGIYRRPEDFARLYGLTKKQYRALEPYIQISDDYQPSAELFPESSVSHAEKNRSFERDTLKYPQKLKVGQYISLNTADTTMLKKVPSIGSTFASRIVRYREQLGGYFSVSQLLEIDGFPEEALKFFVINNKSIHKLNVNKLSLNQLRKHPYINFYQAREICDYRRLKGPLNSLSELHLFKDFSAEDIQRLSPYVSF